MGAVRSCAIPRIQPLAQTLGFLPHSLEDKRIEKVLSALCIKLLAYVAIGKQSLKRSLHQHFELHQERARLFRRQLRNAKSVNNLRSPHITVLYLREQALGLIFNSWLAWVMLPAVVALIAYDVWLRARRLGREDRWRLLTVPAAHPTCPVCHGIRWVCEDQRHRAVAARGLRRRRGAVRVQPLRRGRVARGREAAEQMRWRLSTRPWNASEESFSV